MVDYRERLEAAVAALIDDNIVRFDEITSDIMRDKTTEKVLEVRDGMAQSLFNFADPENDDYEEAVEEDVVNETTMTTHLVTATHPKKLDKYTFNREPVSVRQAYTGDRSKVYHYAVHSSLGAGKHANTPEMAIHSLLGDHAMTVHKIEKA